MQRSYALVIVIGCGDAAPIAQYAKDTSCSFPIYANPDLSLYNLFGFSENLIMVPKEQGGGYGAALGSKWTRIWSYLRDGPLRSPGLIGTTGPVSQNGGEMILEAGEFWYRQNRIDSMGKLKRYRGNLLLLP